jgi:hypothetical protein
VLRQILGSAERQHSDARPRLVDRQERASLNVVVVRVEGLCDDAHDHIGEQVLSSDLHDARRRSTAGREDCREVEVVRDDDEAVLVRPRQDCGVWRGRGPDGGPVDGFEPVVRQPLNPTLATGSCPRAASRLAQWNFDFFCPPGGVGQGLGDVLGFQVGILSENLVARSARGESPTTVAKIHARGAHV